MSFTRFALSATRRSDFAELIAQAETCGLDALEISWPKVRVHGDREIARARETGIAVTAIDAGPIDQRTDIDHVFDLATSLRCRRLTITCAAGPTESHVQLREWFIETLRKMSIRCEELGLSLVVRLGRPSDDQPSTLTCTADLRDVLAKTNMGSICGEIDMSILDAIGEDPVQAAAALIGRLGYVRIGEKAETLVKRDAASVVALLNELQSYGYSDVVEVPAGPSLAQILATLGGNNTLDRQRIEELQTALAANGLDAAVFSSSENVVSISGYWPMNGTCVAIVPQTGEPHLLVPAGEEFWAARCGWPNLHVYQAGRVQDAPLATTVETQLRRLTQSAVRTGGRVGVEGPFRAQVPPHMAHEVSGRHEIIRPVVASALDAETVNFDHVLVKVRARKTPAEIRSIRRTAAIADVGLRTFRDGLADGMRDIDLATEVERAIETFGVGFQGTSRVRAYAYVMSGPQTSQTHLDYEFSSPRRMREGESVLMELAVVADGYWQDLSRIFVIGEPTPQQREIAEVAEAAFEAARKAAIPGATGAQVDQAARKLIGDAGYAAAFPHQTGHGVGIAFHEQFPLLKPGSDHLLEENHVVAIEPGVYIPGVGGVRNEDDLVIGPADGAQSLQSVPHAVNVMAK
jgi:Xaa-Pro dipeptidase